MIKKIVMREYHDEIDAENLETAMFICKLARYKNRRLQHPLEATGSWPILTVEQWHAL